MPLPLLQGHNVVAEGLGQNLIFNGGAAEHYQTFSSVRSSNHKVLFIGEVLLLATMQYLNKTYMSS
jgi:hypothetical protein